MPSRLTEISTGVPRVQIIYDFVSRAEEHFLVEHINHVGGDGTKPSGWRTLNGRRSMQWGGTILANSHALVPTPFPKFLDSQWPHLLDRIADTHLYDSYYSAGGEGNTGKHRGPNHCLVNEYLPAQGILPHTDGPAYHPCTTTLSLSSHTILSLRSNPSQRVAVVEAKGGSERSERSEAEVEVEKLEIFLPARSLVVLSEEIYSDWFHGIQPVSKSSWEQLKRCRNWDGWWGYLVEECRSRTMRPRTQDGEGDGDGDGDGDDDDAERNAWFEDLFRTIHDDDGDKQHFVDNGDLDNNNNDRDERRDGDGDEKERITDERLAAGTTLEGRRREKEAPPPPGQQQQRDEQAEQIERDRAKAFDELKLGLKRLDLLSSSSSPDEDEHDLSNNQSKNESRSRPDERNHADVDDDEEEDEWVKRVWAERRRIERDGWDRGKRISLTCRRVKGKVRDLGGLLSKFGAGPKSKR